MLSKNQIKKIKSLASKKQRRLNKQFLVQGEKNVLELLASNMVIEELFATETFLANNRQLLQGVQTHVADGAQLTAASTLTANNDVIAIVKQHESQQIDTKGIILAVDDVNDPGNLGTIIRLADWYGVKTLLLSEQTADVYNPKTISATMGAFTRVTTHRVDLAEFISSYTHPVYGAFLEGESVHNKSFSEQGMVILGSESHGISKTIEKLITEKITIPSFGQSESLNVAMACGIILDNIRRTLN